MSSQIEKRPRTEPRIAPAPSRSQRDLVIASLICRPERAGKKGSTA